MFPPGLRPCSNGLFRSYKLHCPSMTRVPPRARLHSSELLRVLHTQGLFEPATDAGDVGQRLGHWLHIRDAIALQSFIGEVDKPSALPAAPIARVDSAVLRQRFAKVHDALAKSITKDSPPAPGMLQIQTPATELPHPIDAATAFEPFRRFYSGHQRQMQAIVCTLRTQLRNMLEKGKAAHKQLATLDALFENVLIGHETRLLAQIGTRFEKRFAKILRQHLQQLEQAAQADEPAPRTQPWLEPLLADMRQALLAELDLRLQPVLGLIEALTHDTRRPT